MIKVLVCGGRDLYDRQRICMALDEWRSQLTEPSIMIIHGDAPGVDTIAGDWAKLHGIPEVRVPANWGHYGKSAGPIRNSWMMSLEPDLVLAFPGGSGTADMMRRARDEVIPVTRLLVEQCTNTACSDRNVLKPGHNCGRCP